MKRLITALPVPVPACATIRSHDCPQEGEQEEATVILTLLIAAGAVLLAVIGRALLAPNDDVKP